MMSKEADKICITSYGAVTPLGNDIATIYQNFKNKKSGIKNIKKFNTEGLKTYFAGIPDIGNETIKWPLTKPFKNGEIFYTELAMDDLLARSEIANYYSAEEISCIIGLDKPAFNIDTYLRYVEESDKFDFAIHKKEKLNIVKDTFRLNEFHYADPTSVLQAVNDKIEIGASSLCHLGLCSSSGYSLMMAVRDLLSGKSKVVITGGVSAKVSPYNIARLENMGVTTTASDFTPQQLSRPFDKNRSGFLLAEGAILFTLEKYSDAIKRGATPLAFIEGCGASLGSQHIVAPHTEEVEMLLSMEKALADAGVKASEIDLISAHATSTKQNDYHEAKAIDTIFKENKPIISATKSFHGHLIAASAAMEVLCIILSMKYDYVPGILNLDELDYDIDKSLNFAYDDIEGKKINYALKNAFGMGGLAASLVIKNPRL